MSLPRRPRAVAFDLDGTLIDSEALVHEAHFVSARTLGVEMTDALFLSLIGKHREDNDKILLAHYGPDFPLQSFVENTRAFLAQRTAPLKNGARELMAALDEMAAPFGLVTNSRRHWVERHFAAHALTDRFSTVVTRDDCVLGKPDPEPYARCARNLGFAPNEVLAIEDSPTGVVSAHEAGLMVVVVPDLLAPDQNTRTRALQRNSLDEVRALLTQLA
jgi:HAD superfamily hydrolase (TIGR01509 family)